MNTTPTPSKTMSFYVALEKVTAGAKITKLEWNDQKFYVLLRDSRLQLHKPEGGFHNLIVSEGDLTGQDWVLLDSAPI